MIEEIPLPRDNVVGLRIAGKIEKADMSFALNLIKQVLAENDSVNIYVEIQHFDGVSLSAIAEEMKFLLPNLGRIKKEAVVSNEGWIKKWVAVGDRLFPGAEARHFSFEDKDEALAWLILPEPRSK